MALSRMIPMVAAAALAVGMAQPAKAAGDGFDPAAVVQADGWHHRHWGPPRGHHRRHWGPPAYYYAPPPRYYAPPPSVGLYFRF